LNIALINEAEKYPGVRFHFNCRCTGVDSLAGDVRFSNGATATGDTVIATDGAGSAVRDAFLHGGVERFDFSQVWLEHGYKELHIPPSSGSDLERNALHIWPRHQFMMIALPNFDGAIPALCFWHTGGRKASKNLAMNRQ
jgi:kynurenine 3-monooxygenase